MSPQDLINCFTFVPKDEIVLQTEERNGEVIKVEKVNITSKETKIVYNKG